jgi:hypothetical protein
LLSGFLQPLSVRSRFSVLAAIAGKACISETSPPFNYNSKVSRE